LPDFSIFCEKCEKDHPAGVAVVGVSDEKTMEEISYSEFVTGVRNNEITPCCVFQCRCVEDLRDVSTSKPEARLFSLFDSCRLAIKTIVCCCEWKVCKCAKYKVAKLVEQRHIPSALQDSVLDLSDVKPIYSKVLNTNIRNPDYVHWNDPTLAVKNVFVELYNCDTKIMIRAIHQSPTIRRSYTYSIILRRLFDEYQLIKRNNSSRRNDRRDGTIHLLMRMWEIEYGTEE